jgi:glycosyltransferase involved in cell wall biosynthesis
MAKHGIKQPFILYVGTLEPRKNIQRLVSAFQNLRIQWPQGHLVIAGAKGWYINSLFEIVKKKKLQQCVSFLGFISDEEKFCLMAQAKVFVYPSLYEGFGLPVLEAMALGIPTITSNRSSMPEIAGNAALLVDPEDEAQLHNEILTLILKPDFRKTLGKIAQERSMLFSWDRTASSTLSLYESL